MQAQVIESSDNEIIPDTDEDEDIHGKVQDIILNEDIFGSEESSSKEPESVADVLMKISIEAAKRTQSKKESENEQKTKVKKTTKVEKSQPKKKALVKKKAKLYHETKT